MGRYRMSNPENVTHTNSGIEKEGEWDEITEFAEEVEEVMKDTSIQDKSLRRYRKWRPRTEEGFEELREKTVEHASIDLKKSEKKSDGSKDLVKATKRVVEAGKKIGNNENPNRKLKDASEEVSNFVASKTIISVRKVEEAVYSDMMLRFNPFFFDTEDFSVDMRSHKDGVYRFGVNVPDEDSRRQLKDRFREYN